MTTDLADSRRYQGLKHEPGWYVLQVQTGKESRFRLLALAQGLSEIAHEWYIPLRELMVRRKGGEVLEKKPLYPGYLFLNLSESPDLAFSMLRRVSGFIRFLGNNNAEPLNDRDLRMLQHLRGYGDSIGVSKVEFQEDKRIRVISGPMSGLEGRIIRVDRRKKRARIRLDLYDQTFDVDFGFESIENQ